MANIMSLANTSAAPLSGNHRMGELKKYVEEHAQPTISEWLDLHLTPEQ